MDLAPFIEVADAAFAWNAARLEVNRLKRERNGHRCTEASRYSEDHESPCYLYADENTRDEWCDECKARQPIQAAIWKAQEEERRLRDRMQRVITRNAKTVAQSDRTPEPKKRRVA